MHENLYFHGGDLKGLHRTLIVRRNMLLTASG